MIEVIVAPVEEPVMIEEVKTQLQLSPDEMDEQRSLIDLIIGVAREEVEAFLNRSVMNQTLQIKLNSLRYPIILPRQKVQSVVSITYIDGDGNTQTLTPDQYRLTGWENREIIPEYNIAWPAPRGDADCVTIQWVAGYGDDFEQVPKQIRQWMLMRIQTLYDHRDQLTTGTMITETPGLDKYISFLRVPTY